MKTQRRRGRQGEAPPVLQLTSMIDVVFVLLTFFMLTSTFEAAERELAFRLPGAAQPGTALDLPDEQVVEIGPDGQVRLNEGELDTPSSRELRQLAATLARFRENCVSCGIAAAITIAPDAGAPHQVVVRVLDAANAAGIGQVRFALGP